MERDGDLGVDGSQGPLCFEGSSPRDLASALLCLYALLGPEHFIRQQGR